MSAIIGIAWFVWALIAIFLVFEFVGATSMVRFFPEGRRWWSLPVQWVTLFNFAAVVHFRPF